MDKVQEKLWAKFQELATEQRYAIEILAANFDTILQTKTWEIIKAAKVETLELRKIGTVDWQGLVRRCRRNQLLVAEGQGPIECNPKIADLILRRASLEGRLDKWTKAVDSVMRPWGGTWTRGHYWEARTLIADLRKAVHRNQADTATRLLDLWNSEFARTGADPSALYRLFTDPFDRDWLMSRGKLVREMILGAVVNRAYYGLERIDEAIAMLRELEAEAKAPPWYRHEMAKHFLLRGSLAAAMKVLPVDKNAADEFRGWECSLRGNDQQAIEHFESVRTRVRKETRKRDIVFRYMPGVFYVVSLIRTNEVKRLVEARKYINIVLKRHRGFSTPAYTALMSAIDAVEGKVTQARSLLQELESADLASPLDRLIVCTAACWVDKDKAAEVRHEIIELLKRAERGGYDWIAAESAAVLLRLGDRSWKGDSPGGDHSAMGVVPILDAIPEQQDWERRLAALEKMSGRVDKAATNAPTASRLIWRVSGKAQVERIEPIAQKRTAAGRWTKGRAIALKRLHSTKGDLILTERDIRICDAIKAESSVFRRGALEYFIDLGEALEGLVGHPLVFRADDPAMRVEVVRTEPQLRVKTKGNVVRIEVVPMLPLHHNVLGLMETKTRLAVYVFKPEHREISEVLGPAGLDVPEASEDKIARAVSSVSELVTVHSDIGGIHGDEAEVAADPKLHFHLTPYGDGLQVQPFVRPFAGKGPTYAPGKGGETVFSVVEGRRTRTHRDLKHEQRRLDQAVSACHALTSATWDSAAWMLEDPGHCLEFLTDLQALEDNVVVEWPQGEKFRVSHQASADKLALKLRKQRDWFSIEGELRVDENLVLSLRELLEKVENADGRFVQIGDKQFLALTDRFKQRIEELADYTDQHGKGLRFHPTRAPALEALIKEAGSVSADRNWTDRLEQFREAQALDPKVPTTMQAELRDYQADGYRWAARLAAWGAGACLADDMGLGKTLQALTVSVERAPHGPTLVVAPTSVCQNWMEEARRFTPTLKPIYFGPGDREKMVQGLNGFDLLVCSYGLLHQEAELLGGVEWQTIVLDEAQAIKNRETMRSRAAMGLSGDFKMITTGTPIENHLGELWNLFNFINPGLLGSSESFVKKYAAPIHQRDNREAKMRLKRLIQPFILRRTKSAVLEELPPRTEITLRVEMSQYERALYEAMRQRAMDSVEGRDESAGQKHLRILAEIMKLRRACCHPSLVQPDANILGSKLETFTETVSELVENGHKALVFSQFVDHLSIVRKHLDGLKIEYRYLDGSTPPRERKRQVDRFQAGEGDLFLISLRAGGQGLNLTAADYVIHMDPWWNPAVEDQASDRAHRIGQLRPVTIYRLVMKDTIEEKIVDLHAAKRDLADNLLEGSDLSGKMSADELLELIQTS